MAAAASTEVDTEVDVEEGLLFDSMSRVYDEWQTNEYYEDIEVKTGDRPKRGYAAGGHIVDTAATGAATLANLGIPMLPTAASSAAKYGYEKVDNKLHREKAKKRVQLRGARGVEENIEEYRQKQYREKAAALAEFGVAFQWQIGVIGQFGHPPKYDCNLDKLAEALVENVRYYMDNLSDKKRVALQGRLDSTFFVKGFVEGMAPKGLKGINNAMMEEGNPGKLLPGHHLQPANPALQWNTTSLVLKPGIIVTTKPTGQPNTKPKLYISKYSRVEKYGHRFALSYEMEPGYLEKRGYKSVSMTPDADKALKKYKSRGCGAEMKENLTGRLITKMNTDKDDKLIEKLMTKLDIQPKGDQKQFGGLQLDPNKPIVFKGTEVSQIEGYIDRKDLQQEILDGFSPNHRETRKPGIKMSFNLVNVHGIGGHGKTQVTKRIFELAQQLPLFEGNVIWIHAESKGKPNGIRDQFQKMLKQFGYSNPPSKSEDLKKLVYEELLKDRECLVVMDNVDDFDAVDEYLPTNGLNKKVNVLMTSKIKWNTDLSGWGEVTNVQIGLLSTKEASNFVRELDSEVKESELEEILDMVSRIPADLSFICHSFKAIARKRKAGSGLYSWATHLERYAPYLSTHENLEEVIKGIEHLDYAKSTRQNLACSMDLMAAEDADVGHLAVYMLQTFAFCVEDEISQNYLVYRHTGFREYAKHKCSGVEDEEEKLDSAMGLLVEFSFLQKGEEDEEYDDVIFTINDSYQSAIRAEISSRSKNETEIGSKSSTTAAKLGFKSKTKKSSKFTDDKTQAVDKRSILLELIDWIQPQGDINRSLLRQKKVHAAWVWRRYIKGDTELVMATTKTKEFLKAICWYGDYQDIELWKKHCSSQADFVTKLLDDTDEHFGIYGHSALRIASRKGRLTTFKELVQHVALHLVELETEGKKGGIVPKIKNFVGSASKDSAPRRPELSAQEIHRQMMNIASNSLDKWRAFEILCNNFPLRYYEQTGTHTNRTLLHRVVRVQFHKHRLSTSEVESVLGLHDKYNANLPEGQKRTVEQERDFINHQDSVGNTALHGALHHGLLNVAELLLRKGANVDIQNKHGWNSLRWAIHGLKLKLREINERIANHTTKRCMTGNLRQLYQKIVHYALKEKEAVIEQYSSVIKCILESVKSDLTKFVNAQSKKKGKTALHSAAEAGLRDLVKILLDYGADTEVLDKRDWNSLRWAIYGLKLKLQNANENFIEIFPENSTESCQVVSMKLNEESKIIMEHYLCIIKYILESVKPNPVKFVNAQTKDGGTALHVAAEAGLGNIAKVLLAYGADTELLDENGFNSLHLAIYGFKDKLEKIEESIQAELTGELDTCVSIASLYNLRHLYNSRAGISEALKNVITLYEHEIHFWKEQYSAVIHAILENVKSDKAKFVNAKTDDGKSALHFACKGPWTLAIDDIILLLGAGARVGLQIPSTSETPLHLVMKAVPHDQKLINLLMEKGAGSTVSIKDKKEKSPLDYLDEWGNLPDLIPEAKKDYVLIRKRLLDAEANCKLTDNRM